MGLRINVNTAAVAFRAAALNAEARLYSMESQPVVETLGDQIDEAGDSVWR